MVSSLNDAAHLDPAHWNRNLAVSRTRADAPLPPIEVAPLAGLPGVQIEPAFSPDGNQVAFVLGGTENNCGIYTTMVGGEKSLRLTSDSDDSCPTWSPDGRQIAFYRYFEDGNGVAIYVVPAFGGTEHRLYTGPSNPSARGLGLVARRQRARLFGGADGLEGSLWISLLSLVDSTTRKLTSPSGEEVDYCPAFSPDGSTVAFVRGTRAGAVEDLYVVPTAGGVPTASDLRQDVDQWISHLDSGRSRYRLLFRAREVSPVCGAYPLPEEHHDRLQVLV